MTQHVRVGVGVCMRMGLDVRMRVKISQHDVPPMLLGVQACRYITHTHHMEVAKDGIAKTGHSVKPICTLVLVYAPGKLGDKGDKNIWRTQTCAFLNVRRDFTKYLFVRKECKHGQGQLAPTRRRIRKREVTQF